MGGSSRSTEPSAFESRPGGTVPKKSLVSAQVLALLIVEHQVEAFLKGTVKVATQDNGMIRETVDVRARFSLGLSDSIQPLAEGITLDYNAIPPTPCNLVFIPPGAFVLTKNGFRVTSTSMDDRRQRGKTAC